MEFFAFFKRKTPLFFKKIRTNSPKLCTKKNKKFRIFCLKDAEVLFHLQDTSLFLSQTISIRYFTFRHCQSFEWHRPIKSRSNIASFYAR